MIAFSSKERSIQAEIMDDFNFKGEEMKALLNDLKNVNNRLGGAKITTNALSKLLAKHPKKEQITIIDIGCGDGEMLRECARFGVRNGFNFSLLGFDANSNIIDEAKLRSVDFQNISFKQMDVFSEEMDELKFDIALCTLFLHHFREKQIVDILTILTNKARIGVIINDLERSSLAFNLFKVYALFFLQTKTARHDGLVSIASGFNRKELEVFSNKIYNSESKIKWKWAFRYQWVLRKSILNQE